MNINRRKLYTLLSVALMAGYIWLFFELATNPGGKDDTPGVCLFKSVTHVPCPSCGSTRAILALVQGDIGKSLSINPFGFLLAALMLITPFWIIFDLITRRKTLLDSYRQIESVLRKRFVAVPLILLVLINWIWNISKGL
jgi:hypothetical protein